ncbi:MAG: putative motility protein [Spirochaetes bacterium]|nr:putative motility protein [Spirochaetota bacterium]
MTSAYTSMNQAQTAQQASTAVLKQSMNVQEAQGEGLMKLLASSDSEATQPVQDAMLGQSVDTYA